MSDSRVAMSRDEEKGNWPVLLGAKECCEVL
jgi:hypothetical protein